MHLIEIVYAILFVASSGLFFNQRFVRNTPLMLLAGAVAIVSTYLLGEELLSRFSQNNIIRPDRMVSLRELEAAAATGDVNSEYQLAHFLETNDESTPADHDRATRLYLRAAEHNQPDALGVMCRRTLLGIGTPANPTTALELCQRSAAAGSQVGRDNLALFHRYGIAGIERSEEQAQQLARDVE